MTQTHLARALGVRLATLRGWENDMSEPRANKLQMLAGVLGVSIGWLLTGEGNGPDGPQDTMPAPDARVVSSTIEMVNTRQAIDVAVIDEAQKNISQLSTQMVGLQDILSNKQARGAFGEVQLNDLVQNALPPSA